MAKAILLRPTNGLYRAIKAVADADKRKITPTVIILLEEALQARQPQPPTESGAGA